MSRRALRVVIAGGGTAGHVNPALALAAALGEDRVTFIGTATGLEARLVPDAGWPFESIVVRGFDRSRPLLILKTGLTAARAIAAARRLLRALAPDVVVGMGGYVSLPVCVAARATRIPVVLHEQNIVFGLANRVCKGFAQRIAVSFEDTLEAAGARGVFVGNPVGADMRPDVREACRPQGIARFDLDPGRPTLLIFGGSQGARRVNEAAAGLARRWLHRPDRQVVHITGGSSQHADPGGLSGGELIWRSVPFVERMVEAYAVADLALCRGGATTVAELTAVGVAAVVVPYPYHRDRQQELHGIVLQRAGAGIVLPDREATAERVAAETDALLGAPDRLEDMRRAARAMGVPDAAERLATVVREVAA